MSFETLDRDELLLAAEGFGVEVDEKVPDEAIVELLSDEGATYSRWLEMKKAAGLLEEEAEELKETANSINAQVATEQAVASAKSGAKKKATARKQAKETDEVLVKMERTNLRYEIYGKVFTKDHPYVICDLATANRIFQSVDGFRMAQPLEAQQYYS